ncbi:MAG: hypothetical protein JWQ02_2237 [Capsulimonas sp.]|jgi:hypothetical protein|nr:hypothetical protein [Capsulimonas sp.]
MKTKYVVISLFIVIISALVVSVASVFMSLGGGPAGRGAGTPGLSAKLSGIVLTNRAGGEIDATVFPSGVSYVAVPNTWGIVHAIAGPDAAGQIAYLGDNNLIGTQLHVAAIGGAQDTVIFRSTLAGYGGSFALSPKRGQVALISHLSGVQMPTEYFIQGQLEIWDVTRKTKSPLLITALDNGFAWMPDGKHLIIVELNAQPTARDFQDYGVTGKGWTGLPTAYMLDTVMGTKTKIGAGVWPVVSTNGKFVILDNNNRQPRQVNLATFKSQPLTVPGRRSVILTQDGALIVYGATGGSNKFTYSHGGIGPLGSIKTVQINTGKFQILLRDIDPLSPMSYGPVTPQNQKMLGNAPKVDL